MRISLICFADRHSVPVGKRTLASSSEVQVEVMANVLAHVSRRLLQRQPVLLSTASSSRAYITPTAPLRAKKVAHAAALSLTYEGGGEGELLPPAVQDGVEDVAVLVDQAAALQAGAHPSSF